MPSYVAIQDGCNVTETYTIFKITGNISQECEFLSNIFSTIIMNIAFDYYLKYYSIECYFEEYILK